MALSDVERRQLAELEQLCVHEDPAFARRLRGQPETEVVRVRVLDRRRLVAAALGVGISAILIALGSSLSWHVGVAGWLVLALALLLGIESVHHEERRLVVRPDPTVVFHAEMEDIWRRRAARAPR